MQPYQSHAWHAFLVQLGALAAFHAGLSDVAALRDAEQWAKALRALTDGRDGPWCLIVPDLKAPAFMQPPVPEGSIATWKDDNATATPDAIDLLATAKNHDVKMERIVAPAPEHWIYALVTLQTMQGFSGRDTYGIARMNGGVSNRPAFAVARDLAWPTRFVRDARSAAGSARRNCRQLLPSIPKPAAALLWLEPWDGVEQIRDRRPRSVLHRNLPPYPADRRSRPDRRPLDHDQGDPRRRQGAKRQSWRSLDPVKIEDGAALTAGDLNYHLVHRVIFGDEFRPSRASIPRPGDGDEPLLACQIFVRGQGKTDGYFERLIAVPPKARLRLATDEGRRQIGELSKQRLAEIKDVASKALRPALAALLQGGPDKLNFRDPRLDTFVKPFDREVDRVYFAELFADVELSFENARIKWLEQLLGFARQTLEAAKQSAPIPAARVFRAHAAADRVFHGAARRMRTAAGESIEQKGGDNESPTA